MTTKQIESYLIAHPIDRNQPNCYVQASNALGIDKETIRSIWRKLRRRGLVESEQSHTTVNGSGSFTGTLSTVAHSVPQSITESTGTFSVNGDNARATKVTDTEIKNELDLAEVCDIDLNVWHITEWECKSYNAWIKNKAGEIESQPKFSVYAKMKRKKVEEDVKLQKDIVMKELFEAAPELQIFEAYPEDDFTPVKDTLLEFCLPDLHIGKLAHHDETGEDFDSKIACARFEAAIDELLSRYNLDRVERILFPIGNDMLQVDNQESQTTAGTRVDSDSRFFKMVKIANDLLIKTITRLAVIAPVDVVVVPGNHDQNTMLLVGCVIEAYFHNTDRVTVNNSPAPRKYYQYGTSGFLLCHGNEEKHGDLALIFATEQPRLWADILYRFIQVGHLHKNKKTHFISVNEEQGVILEILPSLSGRDAWHAKKGYFSQRAAKMMVHHREKGRVGEFTYTV